MYVSLTTHSEPGRRKGHWANPASTMTKCLVRMLYIGPEETTRVPEEACHHIQEFFDEVDEVIATRVALHSDTYQLAMRVIVACHLESLLFGEDGAVEDLEMELRFLGERYKAVMTGQVLFSDPEFDEVLRLTTFLEKLALVAETGRSVAFH